MARQDLQNWTRRHIYYPIAMRLQRAHYQAVVLHLIGNVLEIGCGNSLIVARLSPSQNSEISIGDESTCDW